MLLPLRFREEIIIDLLICQQRKKIDSLTFSVNQRITSIFSIGTSLLEADKMDLALEILEKAKLNNVKVFLPVDVIAADEFNNDAHREEVDIYHIPENMMGMDAGSKTREIFHDVIMNSRTILWNGPIGVFEMENFSAGTKALGDSIDEATQLGAFSLVGGGDSVAFVKQNGYADKVSYVSTGGGAIS